MDKEGAGDAIHLDFGKIFGTVSHNILVSMLGHYSQDEQVRNWIGKLTKRKIHTATKAREKNSIFLFRYFFLFSYWDTKMVDAGAVVL